MKHGRKLFLLALTGVMLLSLSISALAADAYSDMTGSEWYAEAANQLREQGIMTGVGGNRFDANGTFTRAQLAQVLYNMAGKPAVNGEDSFTDTEPDAWYADAILWASQNRIVDGIGGGLYGTEKSTTQEQLVTMLWRDAGRPSAAAGASGASSWAAEAVQWARNSRLIQDSANYTFAPTAAATRAQIAVLVARYMESKNAASEQPQAKADIGVFDLESGSVLLNSGHTMPILGIGTYALSDSQAENSVYWALKAGFRLIDTARIYGNESGVGRGIQRAINEGIVKREDIFVTTKMWTSDFGNGAAAINASFNRLGLDYIDLMILHHSQPSNDVQAYQAMEKAVSEGKLRSIGLSNYYTPSDFDRLVNATTIKPALLQNETQPYHQSKTMKEHIAQYGTVMESWFPLGGRGNTQTLFNDETISAIAAAHGKSSAQVIIRWHLQAGNICIPGSSNEQHIIEDHDVWDFALSADEMAQLTALDKNQRFANY